MHSIIIATVHHCNLVFCAIIPPSKRARVKNSVFFVVTTTCFIKANGTVDDTKVSFLITYEIFFNIIHIKVCNTPPPGTH